MLPTRQRLYVANLTFSGHRRRELRRVAYLDGRYSVKRPEGGLLSWSGARRSWVDHGGGRRPRRDQPAMGGNDAVMSGHGQGQRAGPLLGCSSATAASLRAPGS